jgi:hypothetical protein
MLAYAVNSHNLIHRGQVHEYNYGPLFLRKPNKTPHV